MELDADNLKIKPERVLWYIIGGKSQQSLCPCGKVCLYETSQYYK